MVLNDRDLPPNSFYEKTCVLHDKYAEFDPKVVPKLYCFKVVLYQCCTSVIDRKQTFYIQNNLLWRRLKQ